MAVRLNNQKLRSVKRKPRLSISAESIEADFAEPRTIQILAEEQRKFLSSIKGALEDVELPPDD